MTMSVCIDFRKPPVSIFILEYLSLIYLQICLKSFESIWHLVKNTTVMYGSRTVQTKIMCETYNNYFKTLVKTVKQLEALVKENC